MDLPRLKAATVALVVEVFQPNTVMNHVWQADCFIKFCDNYGFSYHPVLLYYTPVSHIQRIKKCKKLCLQVPVSPQAARPSTGGSWQLSCVILVKFIFKTRPFSNVITHLHVHLLNDIFNPANIAHTVILSHTFTESELELYKVQKGNQNIKSSML